MANYVPELEKAKSLWRNERLPSNWIGGDDVHLGAFDPRFDVIDRPPSALTWMALELIAGSPDAPRSVSVVVFPRGATIDERGVREWVYRVLRLSRPPKLRQRICGEYVVARLHCKMTGEMRIRLCRQEGFSPSGGVDRKLRVFPAWGWATCDDERAVAEEFEPYIVRLGEITPLYHGNFIANAT